MSKLNQEKQRELAKLKDNIDILNANIAIWKQDKTIFGGITKIAKGNISKAEAQLHKRQQDLQQLKKSIQAEIQNKTPKTKELVKTPKDTKNASVINNSIDNKTTILEKAETSHTDFNELSPGEDFTYSKNEPQEFLSINFGEEQESLIEKLVEKSDRELSNHELEQLKKTLEIDMVRFRNQWKVTQKEFINFREEKRKIEATIEKIKLKF